MDKSLHEINIPMIPNGQSPPCGLFSFQEGHTTTIKTLLQLGADLHARDKKGRSGKKSS